MQLLIAENNLEKIALHWAKGGKISWESLHNGKEAHRISLPTYPFEKKRYWISKQNKQLVNSEKAEEQGILTNSNKFIEEFIREYIVNFFSKKLNITADEIKLNKNIQDYGINSIIVTKFIRDFEKHFQTIITGREILEYRTINSLSTYLAQKIDIQNNEGTKQDLNFNIKRGDLKMSNYVDEQVIDTLEKYIEGKLNIKETQKLIARRIV